jgi:hypothetical protein
MTRVLVGLIALLTYTGCAGAGASSAVPSEGATGPGLPYACIGLEDAHCLAVLEAARSQLASEDVLVYAEIGPFGCPVEPPCPNTLEARPQGVANLERANGDTVNFGITARPDGTIEAMQDDFPEVAAAPASAAGQLANGPIPFTLGHCGLWSGIDVDGSWWDPIGFVDGDDSAFVNATDGTFTPHDTNHATFQSDAGFEVTLVRRVGDKHLPMCM